MSASAGSSPRMRGTHDGMYEYRCHLGIIPAYAGNTESWCMWFRPAGDHPRVCGEHIYVTNPDLLDSGSSPRMRGTLAEEAKVQALNGIIPAYAGNTASRACSSGTERDHPRVCGEHFAFAFLEVSIEGSSPRMRGTPRDPPTPRRTAGIIPAYAGNTRLVRAA